MAAGQREPFALTLFDYREELNWVNHLGWSEDELRQVPIHEQATAGEDYINLANFGGTTLGVSERGGGTSASIRGVRNLFVYKREVPEHLWNRLVDLVNRGGPSGYQESGKFGERGDADFPPR